MKDTGVEDLDQIAHDHPSRAHIPPEIRAANRSRAHEINERDRDKPLSPEGERVIREIFMPAYFRLLAEQQAQRDAEEECGD